MAKNISKEQLDAMTERIERSRINLLKDEVKELRPKPKKVTEKQRRQTFKESMDEMVKKPARKNKKEEENLSIQVCNYLKTDYPDVIFTAESSGIRVPIHVAAKMKKQRSDKGLPDLIILEPNQKYKGICLELKKEGVKIFKDDGSLYANEHHQEQHEILGRLRKKGYWAEFSCGFDATKKIIDWYMKLSK
jgi:hypothetical protein